MCNETDENECDYTHDDAYDAELNATDNTGVDVALANICANDDAKDYANHIRFTNDDHSNGISYISDYSFINI